MDVPSSPVERRPELVMKAALTREAAPKGFSNELWRGGALNPPTAVGCPLSIPRVQKGPFDIRSAVYCHVGASIRAAQPAFQRGFQSMMTQSGDDHRDQTYEPFRKKLNGQVGTDWQPVSLAPDE